MWAPKTHARGVYGARRRVTATRPVVPPRSHDGPRKATPCFNASKKFAACLFWGTGGAGGAGGDPFPSSDAFTRAQASGLPDASIGRLRSHCAHRHDAWPRGWRQTRCVCALSRRKAPSSPRRRFFLPRRHSRAFPRYLTIVLTCCVSMPSCGGCRGTQWQRQQTVRSHLLLQRQVQGAEGAKRKHRYRPGTVALRGEARATL